MTDAVLTSVLARAITIFAGSPGRGKIIIASAVLKALGMRCTRINLSPTMTAEDLLGHHIPQSAPEGISGTPSIPNGRRRGGWREFFNAQFSLNEQ
jgi:MoxR-like ATPase